MNTFRIRPVLLLQLTNAESSPESSPGTGPRPAAPLLRRRRLRLLVGVLRCCCRRCCCSVLGSSGSFVRGLRCCCCCCCCCWRCSSSRRCIRPFLSAACTHQRTCKRSRRRRRSRCIQSSHRCCPSPCCCATALIGFHQLQQFDRHSAVRDGQDRAPHATGRAAEGAADSADDKNVREVRPRAQQTTEPAVQRRQRLRTTQHRCGGTLCVGRPIGVGVSVFIGAAAAGVALAFDGRHCALRIGNVRQYKRARRNQRSCDAGAHNTPNRNPSAARHTEDQSVGSGTDFLKVSDEEARDIGRAGILGIGIGRLHSARIGIGPNKQRQR
jgi:hypothetical protein